MYKFTLDISIDKEDIEPEELFNLIAKKLEQAKNNVEGLDVFISGGAINDEIGKCSYKVFDVSSHTHFVEV